MCLTKDYNLSEKFLKRKRKHNFIYAYKVLNLLQYTYADRPLLTSVYYQQMCYKPGYNKADIPNLSYTPVADIVLNGIHVYLTRQEAEIHKVRLATRTIRWSFYRVVKVKCFIHDFLGKNDTEAAFSKVFVSKAEYQKTITSTNRW